MERNLEALQHLANHPGWQVLLAHLKGRSDSEMAQMRNAKSQDELLKHTYTYMALADLPNAPALLAGVLKMKLQEHKNKL